MCELRAPTNRLLVPGTLDVQFNEKSRCIINFARNRRYSTPNFYIFVLQVIHRLSYFHNHTEVLLANQRACIID